MQTGQLIAVFSTILIFLLTILLAVSLSLKYKKTKGRALLFWSLGMWAFTIGVALEIIFALGTYNSFLGGFYLLDVALIVELLALGSMQLVKSNRIKNLYYLFVVVTTAALLYSIAVTPVGNIVVNYVASGQPSLLVIYASSAVTFMASIVLVVLAALSYKRRKDPRLLSIILGVIVVVIAGTLYIVSFPEFLYYSEFIGILLLWFGFSSPKK